MRRAIGLPLLIAASGVAVGAVLALGVSGPPRVAVAFCFLIVCTGLAFVPLLGIRLGSWAILAAVPVTGLVLDTLVATALTLAGNLSEVNGLVAILGLCLVGYGLQMRAGFEEGAAAPRPSSPS